MVASCLLQPTKSISSDANSMPGISAVEVMKMLSRSSSTKYKNSYAWFRLSQDCLS